jgi:CHAT domain-containing protein
MKPTRSGGRRAAAAVAMALLAAVAVHQGRRWLSTVSVRPDSLAPTRAALVHAADGMRVFEPRLSGGFRHAPHHVVRATGRSSPPPELKIAAARVEIRAHDDDRAAAQADLGAAQLLLGNADAAVEALEEAVAREPAHLDWTNDLAAALMVRGSEMSRGDDIVRALDLLERVARRNPASPEALFNRALVLETIGLREHAARAWREYLDRERAEAWAEEGKTHLRQVTGPSPRQDWREIRECLLDLARPLDETVLARAAATEAQATRELIEEEVLGTWAAAVLKDDVQPAAAWLVRAGQVANALRAAGRDPQLADTVRALERLSRADRAGAADGIRAYLEGRANERNGQYVEAAPSFKRCGRLLAGRSVPHAAWCQLFNGLGAVYSQRLDEAGTTLGHLERYAKSHNYRTLLGRVHWMRAFIASGDDRLLTTKEEYERAASLFETAGESAFLLHVRNNLATTLTGLGASTAAWTQRLEILKQIDRFGEDNRRYVTLDSFGVTALQEGLPFTAAHFHGVAVAAADASGLTLWQAEARIHRARVRSALGEISAAREDIRAADSLLEHTTDVHLKRELAAERAAVLGELWLARDDRQAAANFDDAVAGFRALGLPVRLPLLLLQRGRALERMADRDGARYVFDEGIALLQAEGKALPMGFRFSQSERSWELFAEAIRLRAASADQPCAGLELAERARATMWPEPARDAPNTGVSKLIDELPEGADVLYYSLGTRESFAWVLSRGRCEAVRLHTTEGELERLVGIFLRQIRQHADAKRILNTSRELHKRILDPLRTQPLSGECLVIVPDGALHRLPFALLRDGDRFLIEERPILIATSLMGFVDASRRVLQRTAPLNRALIVADPATDEAAPLPGARAQAVDLAQVYPHPTLLTGQSATRKAISAAIPDADVLHYAGHAVDDTFHPERSRLLLAKSSNDVEQGSLSVKDLFTLPRRVPSLVVLAACGTRGSRVYRGQGSLGLSTPFLVKGVPSVVATLWDVDDRAGAPLTAAIHKAARSGESVVTALRRVQIELLRSGEQFNSHWDWAAYVLIGGWRQARGESL